MIETDCPCLFCELQRLPPRWREAHAWANQKDSPSIGIECADELDAVLEQLTLFENVHAPGCTCAWCTLKSLPGALHMAAAAPVGEAPSYLRCAADLETCLEALGVITQQLHTDGETPKDTTT